MKAGGGTPAGLTLVRVSPTNWRACAALSVAPSQQHFVYTAAFSLAECAYTPELMPFAIELDATVVGHMVLRREGDCGWIHRVIIDKAHQGCGYGTFAVRSAISMFASDPNCREIRLAILPENDRARRIYQALGFRCTPDYLNGDEVLVLTLAGVTRRDSSA